MHTEDSFNISVAGRFQDLGREFICSSGWASILTIPSLAFDLGTYDFFDCTDLLWIIRPDRARRDGDRAGEASTTSCFCRIFSVA